MSKSAFLSIRRLKETKPVFFFFTCETDRAGSCHLEEWTGHGCLAVAESYEA